MNREKAIEELRQRLRQAEARNNVLEGYVKDHDRAIRDIRAQLMRGQACRR